jgi:hypothetical protein
MDGNDPGEETREAEQRRRVRRFALGLLALIAALVVATFAYVQLYDRVLRDPDSPPSVKSLNPRVLAFEVALWAVVALGAGFALNQFLRKRR